ncbi:MAG: metallophosphoesterase [Pseudomonadota bacterium]
MKLVWVTDIHLNFVDSGELDNFCGKITSLHPDAVLIGGDIGEAPSITNALLTLAQNLRCPIYFALGNHDYYHGSVCDVRDRVQEVTENSSYLQYLSNAGIVRLTSNTCLVGHDSWADGRYGNYFNSDVMLNDYAFIEELSNLDKQARLRKLKQLGDEAAYFFREHMRQALLRFEHILVLTHAPPFIEACWHEGNLFNDDFLPHFCCKATGDVFTDLMRKHPNQNLTIFCGHTHSSGMCQILPNIFVKTGGTVYGQPHIQDPFILKD